MNTLTKEKQPVKEYAIAEQKKYEFEKELQKSATHIFLKKESEFTSVSRIINNFKKRSGMEFETLFKLYKFQNYGYSPEYLLGTSYKYGTLVCMASYIKCATNGLMSISAKKPGYSTNKIIYDFVNEIKSVSQPFPYIFDDKHRGKSRKKISDLVASETLSKEEMLFITTSLNSANASTYEQIHYAPSTNRKVIKSNILVNKTKEKNMTNKRTKQFLTESDYRTIVSLYKKGVTHVASLLPHMNRKTISNYIRSCKLLERNIVPNRTCPEQLKYLFDEMYSNYSLKSTSTKNNSNQIQITHTPIVESYCIVKDSSIVVSDSDEMYVRGYYDCGNDGSWKLYRMVEI